MTDFSAYDIHRLDQAYPDALADIEHLTGDPTRKRRLADAGPEVFAAELTRELAATFTNPMSLAGWAAIATTRLIEAGQMWEEDTDMAYEQRDAARAEVDRLTAERDAARDMANTENLRLREQVFAQKPVIEAAEAWAVLHEETDAVHLIRRRSAAPPVANLYDAVEQYRVMDLALTTAREEKPPANTDDQPCCGYRCQDNTTGVTA